MRTSENSPSSKYFGEYSIWSIHWCFAEWHHACCVVRLVGERGLWEGGNQCRKQRIRQSLSASTKKSGAEVTKLRWRSCWPPTSSTTTLFRGSRLTAKGTSKSLPRFGVVTPPEQSEEASPT